MSSTNTPEDPGVRERGKRERRRRIHHAAREIFRAAGFENATTRAIAARAGVGVGTLFRYARDKRDLLFMVVNDDLDVVTAQALETIDPAAPLLDQLTALLRPRYEYWGVDPALSLYALQEVRPFRQAVNAETDRYNRRRKYVLGRVAELVAAHQRLGRITAHEDPAAIARTIWAIYLFEVLDWLREPDIDVDTGIARLRTSLRLVIGTIAQ